MTRTITYDYFQQAVKEQRISSVFEEGFEHELVFIYPIDLDKRSGFFIFMTNYIKKQIAKKLKLSFTDLAEDSFSTKDNHFFFKNDLILAYDEEEIKETNEIKIIYKFFDLKKATIFKN